MTTEELLKDHWPEGCEFFVHCEKPDHWRFEIDGYELDASLSFDDAESWEPCERRAAARAAHSWFAIKGIKAYMRGMEIDATIKNTKESIEHMKLQALRDLLGDECASASASVLAWVEWGGLM